MVSAYSQSKQKWRVLILLLTLGSGFGLFFSESARSASSLPQEEIVMGYRELLQMAAVDPPSEADSIFFKAPVLTGEQIDGVTEEIRTILYNPKNARARDRVLLLQKIENQAPLTHGEKNQILHELFSLQYSAHSQMEAEEDQEEAFRSKIRSATSVAVSIGFTIASAYSVIPVSDDSGVNQIASWGIYSALAGLSGLGSFYSFYLQYIWNAEHYQGYRNWKSQLNQWGPKIDEALGQNFDQRSGYNTRVFPALPYYSALLNRAASRFLDLPGVIDGVSGQVQVPPRDETVTIAISTPVSSPSRFSIRNNRLSDFDFRGLNSDSFHQHVRELCDEVSRRPYSLWNQMVLRRLFFLALNREDVEALALLMQTSLKDLGQVFGPQFERVFLLGVSQNHFEVVRYFLLNHGQSHLPRLSPQILARARDLAERAHQTEMAALIAESINGVPPRPREMVTLRQTASHDPGSERRAESIVSRLKGRYLKRYLETFPETRKSEAPIIPLVLRKIDSLRSNEKLSSAQVIAVKSLLARIEEPFDTQSPGYNPSDLFLWNTEAKKKNTQGLLKLVYLALEDASAYQENTGQVMTSGDRDDHWKAWILNALYDGEAAYHLDQGRHLDSLGDRSGRSCVAGVDHRIIHGLTGIHPDVPICAGAAEKENLLTWRRAQTRLQEEKKAHFFNAVFEDLVDEWAQKKALVSMQRSASRSRAQIVPGLEAADPLSVAVFVKDYEKFVTERAIAALGPEILISDEFKMILETIEDNSDRIVSALRRVRLEPRQAI